MYTSKKIQCVKNFIRYFSGSFQPWPVHYTVISKLIFVLIIVFIRNIKINSFFYLVTSWRQIIEMEPSALRRLRLNQWKPGSTALTLKWKPGFAVLTVKWKPRHTAVTDNWKLSVTIFTHKTKLGVTTLTVLETKLCSAYG